MCAKLIIAVRAASLVVDLVGGIKHVQEVLRVAQALVGWGCIAPACPVVSKGSNGRNLACSHSATRGQLRHCALYALGRVGIIGVSRKHSQVARPSRADAVLWNSLHGDMLAAGHVQAGRFALYNGAMVHICKMPSMLSFFAV